jgi:YD repeat-containing protein
VATNVKVYFCDLIVLGSGARTKTRIGCYDSTCLREPTCPATLNAKIAEEFSASLTATSFAESYNHDYLGDVTSSLNGWDVTPFTLSYSYNRAGRLTGMTSSFSDSNHPATLFSGAHYNAAGSFASATLDGGVINESRSYDSRLRLNGISDSAISTTFFSLSVPTNGYAPNSNMLSVSDTVTNSQQNWSEQRSWTYGYDDFNRLSAANESDNMTGQAAYSYAYDRFGNRWQQNGPSSMMLTFSGNNNRIDAANGVSYDAAGNVIGYHPPAGDTFSYAYDSENRLKSVTDQTTGNQTCYTYDANGRRVERTYNCGTGNAYSRDFLYDLDGQLISQVEGGKCLGSWRRLCRWPPARYIRVGWKRVL